MMSAENESCFKGGAGLYISIYDYKQIGIIFNNNWFKITAQICVNFNSCEFQYLNTNSEPKSKSRLYHYPVVLWNINYDFLLGKSPQWHWSHCYITPHSWNPSISTDTLNRVQGVFSHTGKDLCALNSSTLCCVLLNITKACVETNLFPYWITNFSSSKSFTSRLFRKSITAQIFC